MERTEEVPNTEVVGGSLKRVAAWSREAERSEWGNRVASREANTSSEWPESGEGPAEGTEGISRISPLTDGRWCNPKCWGLEAPPPTGP